MERRVALKNIALTLGGMVSIPAWAEGWNSSSVKSYSLFISQNQENLLAEIVETIIPTTDTPGAKTIGVDNFIKKMISDCYTKSDQAIFFKGLDFIDSTSKQVSGKFFADSTAVQKMEILKTVSESKEEEIKRSFSIIKGLTIHGYLNSEYVMTNLLKYEMIPGRFNGSFPVKK